MNRNIEDLIVEIKPVLPKISTRNKEKTKQLFIQAASQIVIKEGVKGLGINKVSKLAGRSKRLLYDYFGGLDGLIIELVKENDHWLVSENHSKVDDCKNPHENELSGSMLRTHFHQLHSNRLLQDISLLELIEKSDVLTELAKSREQQVEKLFAQSKDHLSYSDVHIGTLKAVLIAGINYLTLHAKMNSGTFCGIDVNDPEDQGRLLKTLEQITKWPYDNGEKSAELA